MKSTTIVKARGAKSKKASYTRDADGFLPCSPDMTLCGDCEGNRAKNTCPRLKEWTTKKGK